MRFIGLLLAKSGRWEALIRTGSVFGGHVTATRDEVPRQLFDIKTNWLAE